MRHLVSSPSPPDFPTRPAPTLTVIIPTKGRPGALSRTLATLLAQTRPAEQLIIVDQSPICSRRDCRQLHAAASRPPQWLYLHEPALNGGAAARNRAMAFARGDIWLFLDDDVELERDFVAALLAAYQCQAGAIGMAGLITNYPAPTWRRRGWDALFRRGLFRDDRQPLYWRAARLRSPAPLPVSRFSGSAMSFRAAAIGGLRFDPRLTGVSNGEDVAFCLALTGGGPGLFVAPCARFRHLRDPAGRSREHWVHQTARDAWFLFLSRRSAAQERTERIHLAWLECGLALGAGLSAARHRSWSPLRALASGKREAREVIRRAPAAAIPG